MKFSIFGIGSDIGVDLGTHKTRVSLRNGTVELSEPSVVAVDKINGKVVAVGLAANEMLGRTPENIVAFCPMQDGVVADMVTAAAMVKEFIGRAGKRASIKPRVAVSVPCGITEVERRAVVEVFLTAGARSVVLIEEPMAAAIGAGLPVCDAVGSMVINVGSGTCEVAIISVGGIVCARSVRCAGDAMDISISNYIKNKYQITISEQSAEEIKMEIGSAQRYDNEKIFTVKGRESTTGLPKNVNVTAEEIREAMREGISAICDAVMETLSETPPSIAKDLMENGIVLTGGGALIKGLDKKIESMTGIKTRIADNPSDCVCEGLRMALDNPTVIERSEVARKI